ncbi:MAG: Fe-S cluster assembly protein SufD [Gammaproteobacteria bacterium]|nr:Fe-S cluster assembly protein SufD [Gammaproteobacteria bacterium]
MPDFMQVSLDRAAASAPPWLQDYLRAGRQRWEASSLPTRKTEQWKYTGLQSLQPSYAPARHGAMVLADAGIELPRFGGFRLVFVNGRYAPEYSDQTLPQGVTLVRFAAADADQAARIRSYLGDAVGREQPLFTALNDAALEEGVFLEIEAGVRLEQPVHIVWVSGNQAEAFSINQRLLVLCGAAGTASVIEHFVGARSEQQSFTNGVTELLVEAGATLNHYRLHQEEAAAVHIGRVQARLAAQATLNSFHLALGSVLKRVDLVVDHCGQGAHSEVNGIYLPHGNDHVDYHTCIEHRVPNCTSSETFRGIIGDEATAVFNGRIHIHRDAQKTNAQLSNRNLLTSTRAEINTKPELEIYADDVQCSHGATVAQLDEMSLHYLRSRGVSSSQAQVMLSFGFINEVIDTVRCESLREYLQGMLARRFARDPALAASLS